MATIESLVVKISAETSGLTKAIDRTRTALKNLIPTGFISSVFGTITGAIGQLLKSTFGQIFDEILKIVTKRAKEMGERIKKAVAPEFGELQDALFQALQGPQIEGIIRQFEEDAVKMLQAIIPQATQFVREFDMRPVIEGLKSVVKTVELLGEALSLVIVPLRVVAGIGKFLANDIGASLNFAKELTGGGKKGAVETEDSALLEENKRQTEALRSLGDKLGAGSIAVAG